jgi:hypothetical protein
LVISPLDFAVCLAVAGDRYLHRTTLERCRDPKKPLPMAGRMKGVMTSTTNARHRPLLGKLTWGIKDFSESANDIHLEWEGDTKPKNPILHAELMDGEENHDSCVNLADCIKNEDGRLRFMECF